MKKLLFVMLLISSISYSFYSLSSDRDNKRKIEVYSDEGNKKKKKEVCSFIPFKTYQEFLEEQKKTTGKEDGECYEAYDQWYSQWLENNENLAYQEYLKKPHPAKQEFEKYLPQGLRKDIGNIIQSYLYVDFKQWQENNKQLLYYAKESDIKSIQDLLTSGDVDINAQNRYGFTALMWAASQNYKELVELLIEKGANVNIQNRYGNTALMKAVEFDYKELVRLLIEKGANVNTQDRNGNTALMWATSQNYKELVELLIEKGANVNIQNRYGSTALMWAASRNYKEIFELLFEKGANINAQDRNS